MTYTLGSKSLANLDGVHPKLVAVVKRAVTLTTQDFTVFEGVRTPARQREFVARGVSKTMNSMHLVQGDGFGHAFDLVPWIDGVARWEWPPIYHIASAVSQAARAEDVQIVWGGVWDRTLNSLPYGPEALQKAVSDYCSRHPGPDFIDGPHYQLAA